MKQKFTLLLLSASLLYTSSNAQAIHAFAGNGYGAGAGIGGYSGDGSFAYAAKLYNCTGVTYDGAGNVYIADMGNNVVRKVNTAGIISTFAGTGAAGYSGDNGAAIHAQLNRPQSVATDIAGNVYVSDNGNNAIRMIDAAGNIHTIAGNGAAGYSGDGDAATAAQLNSPLGITVDNSGNLYIADGSNHAIREIYTDGTISTIAGSGSPGYTGNGGPAVYAKLNSPASVAVDLYGNIYIADYNNNVVRVIDAAGNINNFAGTSTAGFSGDNGPALAAQLRYPSGVSVYGFGDVYIADQGNNRVRKVNTSGVITTVAGTGTNGYIGDGGPAANAQLSSPSGVSVDGAGRVYVADYNNNVIRVITVSSTSVAQVGGAEPVNVYPNPSAGVFTIESPFASGRFTVYDMLGRVVASDNISAQKQTLDAGLLPGGNYILKVTSGDKSYRQQIVIR